jgi:alginate O-acetyltransferase complex protein AlgJ
MTTRRTALAVLLLASICGAGEMDNTIIGTGGWLFFGPELQYLNAGKFWGEDAARVSRASKPEWADPLPAILDFKKQLDKHGVELILVPVPAKASVYAGELESPPPGPVHGEFYRLLAEQGITVIALDSELKTAAGEQQMYCRTDTHWSGRACVLAAERIAARIKQQTWWEAARDAQGQELQISTEWRSIEIRGDLARQMPDVSAETIEIREVSQQTPQGKQPVAESDASPIVLLGDSHCLVFHGGGDLYATGAGLPDQLTAELGLPVDVVAVRGSGATPSRINLMRKARRDAAYLKGKKVVIWCFTVREFTESSGWRPVPFP